MEHAENLVKNNDKKTTGKACSSVNVTLMFLSSRWSDKIFWKECWNDIM